MYLTILTLTFLSLLLYQYSLRQEINVNQIHTLLRQTGRWTTASLSDQNPFIANLHANYGQGYLMALEQLYTDYQIRKTTGVDMGKLSDKVTKAQDRALKMVSTVCPEGEPKDKFLAKMAKQGV